MAKSPLERAARALCELDGNPPGATMDGKPLWMDYLPEARTVLQAIREPDDSMQAAGDSQLGSASCHAIWEAMIDAAIG